MKKSKKVKIVCCILILIAVIIGIIIFFICHKQDKINSGNLNEISEYFDSFYDIESIDKESVSYALIENTFIEVKKVKYSSDNTGKATITVIAPDLEKIVLDSVSVINDDSRKTNIESKKKIQENMINILKNNQYETNQTELEVEIKKIDGKWKFIYNEELGKAITCDLSGLFKKYIQKMFSGE